MGDYAKSSVLGDYAKSSALDDYAKSSVLGDYAKISDMSSYVNGDALKTSISDPNFFETWDPIITFVENRMRVKNFVGYNDAKFNLLEKKMNIYDIAITELLIKMESILTIMCR